MEQTQPTKSRLVIVDDEPVILSLLGQLFDNDFDVYMYSAGEDATRGMHEHGVDILLTDKNLPDVGGLELLERCKALQPDAEVLLITGYASLDSALAALEKGAFDYIVKPPKSIFEVKRKVEAAQEKQRLSRQNVDLVHQLKTQNLELKNTLDELKRVQSELIQSEKLAGIGTLAAGVAHEVASPLFGVLGLAEAIVEESDVETIHGFASEIIEYSTAIKDIVTELRGYVRTPNERDEDRADVQQVIAQARRLVTRSFGIDDDVIDVKDAHVPAVAAHAGQLQQVFVNLFKNGVEACMDEGREPRVHVAMGSEAEGTVWIEVADEGPGISSDHAHDIFDPFYTTKPPGKGTGLGLNIVYRILTRYRGRVSLVSGEGEGARFRIELPTVKASA